MVEFQKTSSRAAEKRADIDERGNTRKGVSEP